MLAVFLQIIIIYAFNSALHLPLEIHKNYLHYAFTEIFGSSFGVRRKIIVIFATNNTNMAENMEMPKQFDNLNSKVVDDLKITLKSSKGRGGALRG